MDERLARIPSPCQKKSLTVPRRPAPRASCDPCPRRSSPLRPALRQHLPIFVKDEPGTLVFPGAKGGPLRRGNFNKLSAWPQAAEAVGTPGLHFHDLRHTGNHFAALSGAGLKDLMARMGHASMRAALIYQHEVQGADMTITSAIDSHVQAEQRKEDDDDGAAGVLVPVG
jgi:hypothetical protein